MLLYYPYNGSVRSVYTFTLFILTDNCVVFLPSIFLLNVSVYLILHHICMLNKYIIISYIMFNHLEKHHCSKVLITNDVNFENKRTQAGVNYITVLGDSWLSYMFPPSHSLSSTVCQQTHEEDKLYSTWHLFNATNGLYGKPSTSQVHCAQCSGSTMTLARIKQLLKMDERISEWINIIYMTVVIWTDRYSGLVLLIQVKSLK